jgi:hypothetical protein
VLEQIADQRRGIDRRVKPVSFRFPDRRLGFVRRQTPGTPARTAYHRTLAAYRSQPRALAAVLVTVALLNVADLALTLRALQLGAVELNPIMAALLGTDPLLASVFKLAVGFGVVAAMWAMRRYRRVLEASLLLLGGFTLLVGYSVTMVVIAG